MKIAIIGTGYQGLVVGTCLAETGHQVTCVEPNAERLAALRDGQVPFHEPGLEELLVRNQEEERLAFTGDLVAAIDDCLSILFCVNPPVDKTGQVDTTELLNLAATVATSMKGYRLFVNKGACPPGTAVALEAVFAKNTNQPFDVIVNPDFLKAGKAVDDFMHPDRVIVGCDDVRVQELIREIYSPFVRTGRPILFMNKASAEISKYATSVMLAARISMMNQLADICSAVGADVARVREGLACDERIGSTFLFPGLGYAGTYMPDDVAACQHFAEGHGVKADLIGAVQEVNTRRQDGFETAVVAHYNDRLDDKVLAFWGAAFKPQTDDIRGSVAVRMIDRFLEQGAVIQVHDPVAGPALRKRYGDRVMVASKPYDALAAAHGLIITTEWNNYRRPNFSRMAEAMANAIIFDGRNLYQPGVPEKEGFTYFSIGR
ncbi:MAG: UDP-glucose/GDP-mannose dehydrogenase family protein [Candidatus Hydrogenedentes bacterium]|nr:UDP-glucose/GDP-mannose dehydrogenase family protein [Candidatus Hydrogenedentota bacterium]